MCNESFFIALSPLFRDNGMDLGKLIGVVFIDLKKAFYTVDHDIICQKLECYDIQGRNYCGLDPISPIGSNLLGLTVLTHQPRK